MSFPSAISSSSSNQGSYPMNSSSSPSVSPSSHSEGGKLSTDKEMDSQTGLPFQPSSFSSNEGLPSTNIANAEQTRVQAATKNTALQNATLAMGTEEDLDDQDEDVQDEFDQVDLSGEETPESPSELGKIKGGNNFKEETSTRGFSSSRTSDRGISGTSQRGNVGKRGSIQGESIGSRGGNLGKGIVTKEGLGSFNQKGGQRVGGGGHGGFSSKSSPVATKAKSSVLGDVAYSVVKDVGDDIYSQVSGALYNLKTAYVDTYGVPAIFPPTDTFNVYVAECEAETTSNNTQWLSVNAQVDAINGMSTQEEISENNAIQQTLNAIAQEAAAAAAHQKAQATANIIEDVGITVAVVMIVASIACYCTGVGAGAGVALDEATEAELTGTAAAEGAVEAGSNGAVDEASDEAADAAANAGQAADRRALTATSDPDAVADATAAKNAQSASALTTEDEAEMATRNAITEEDTDALADAKAAAAKPMTLNQLASWQFMGITSLLMAIPQVGDAATADLTNSLKEDGLNSQDAPWVSMLIITVSMIIAGGLLECGSSLFSTWSKAGESSAAAGTTTTTESATADSTKAAADEASATTQETTNLTFEQTLQRMGSGIYSTTKASYQAAKSMLIGMGKMARGGASSTKAMAGKAYNDMIEAGTELLTNPQKAAWATMKVTGRVLYKMVKGFYDMGLDVGAFSDAATAAKNASWNEMRLALSKGMGSCLPMIMMLGQSMDSAMNVYESTLDLKAAQAEDKFFNYTKSSLEDKASANSTESSIQACDQALNQMIQVINSMMTNTEQSMGNSQQPIAS